MRREAALLAILTACTPRGAEAPPQRPAKVAIDEEEALAKEIAERLRVPIEYDAWAGMAGNATYLTPRGELADEDGGVDVIVHFNAAQMAEKEWRKSQANAVIVSAA